MSSSEFDVAKIIPLWTQLLQLQVDIGYHDHDDSISFPPLEGRAVDETLCQELGLADKVIFLLKHLPCPATFDDAYDTPILYESMAVPFENNEWIRNSRDPERCWCAGGDTPLRLDFMKSGDITLVLAMDEPGHHLILDTKAGTARFFDPMDPAFNSWEVNVKCERPEDPTHYRNYSARPALDVLEELLAKFRDLEYIPMRYDQRGPQFLTAEEDADESKPNIYTNAKNILRQQFGWPNKFNKEDWNRRRNDVWKQLENPLSARLADSRPLRMYVDN